MKHLFVSYETAKLLKEKGFNDDSWGFYNDRLDNPEELRFHNKPTNGWIYHLYSAPLYQQVIDWLREKHNIEIHNGVKVPKEAIEAAKGKLDNLICKYVFYIYKEDSSPRIPLGDIRVDNYYEGLNEAILEAIKLI